MSTATIKSTCVIFREAFETTSSNRAYCSSKCRLRAYRLRYGADPDPPQPDTVKYREQVLSLLARNVSKQKIADQLKIGRGSVERIVMNEGWTRRTRLAHGVRCPGCRAKVNELPCLLCQLRSGK